MQIASKDTSAPLEISLSTSPGESARNTPYHLTARPLLLTNLRNSFDGITTRQPRLRRNTLRLGRPVAHRPNSSR
jgi:hypothetical protein